MFLTKNEPNIWVNLYTVNFTNQTLYTVYTTVMSVDPATYLSQCPSSWPQHIRSDYFMWSLFLKLLKPTVAVTLTASQILARSSLWSWCCIFPIHLNRLARLSSLWPIKLFTIYFASVYRIWESRLCTTIRSPGNTSESFPTKYTSSRVGW